MIYLQLLWSFFQIGLFSIGGGYAAMPLIQHQVVDLHPWLTMTEFADIMTIAEMTPGPIAINSATFVGIQVAGIPGALVATLGCVLPSCVIVTLLACVRRWWPPSPPPGCPCWPWPFTEPGACRWILPPCGLFRWLSSRWDCWCCAAGR